MALALTSFTWVLTKSNPYTDCDNMDQMITYNRYNVSDDIFECLDRYSLKKLIGKGAYGKVCSADDNSDRVQVAIKKISSTFRNTQDARRTLVEIKILSRLSDHENIVTLRDIFPPPSLPLFNDVYIVYDLMETDLHQVLKSPQHLEREHVKYIMYQLLRGLKYIHSAGIIHRDLKPSNLLLSSNCDLQICDFGLSSWNGSQEIIPEYVVTRWYRAPEVLLSCSNYDESIDIWSAGCIFAEILGRRPIFPGTDWLHTLTLIFKVLGTPSYSTIQSMKIGESSQKYLSTVPQQSGISFQDLFPQAEPSALDLLSKMLNFDSMNRITADEALRHPYFDNLHEPCDEPVYNCSPIDCSFENMDAMDLRREIFQEILNYNPELAS